MVEARAGVEATYTDLQTRGLHRSTIAKQKHTWRWSPTVHNPSSTPEYSVEPPVFWAGFGQRSGALWANLAQLGDEQLISRSQAKRLIARFERFKSVILDFKGVNEIGQAFSDELFRVYRLAHPAIEIAPVNMTPQVEQMWLRAVAPRTN